MSIPKDRRPKMTGGEQEQRVQEARPTRLGMSAVAFLFAALVAAVTWGHLEGGLLCTSDVRRGANIDHALGVAFLGGVTAPLLLLFVRKRRRIACAVLLLGAATLLGAMALATADSAHYAAVQYCGLFDSTRSNLNESVYYLYFLWGASLGVVLWVARRLGIRRGESEAQAPRRPSGRRHAWILGIVVLVTVAVSAVAASGSHQPSSSHRLFGSIGALPARVTSTANGLPGSARVNAMFKRIPQHGMTLGSPRAPVTLVAYIELQCPYCREFETNVLPIIVKRYVATGKVKIEARPLAFLGPDSNRGRNAMIAAAGQNKAFNFAELLYLNQGAEDSGWLSDHMVARIAKSIPGLDPRRLFAARSSDVKRQARNFDREGREIEGTPTLFVGTRGRKSAETAADAPALTKAIDRVLRRASAS
jgi:protein-disulfide isomerase